jgi:hydroxyacylglutathione hydrolase
MKKIVKRTLWVIGAVVILWVIMFVWYGIKATSESKKMYPSETGQLVDSIYCIKDSFVNMYLVASKGKFIAIDAGNSIDGIKAGLSKLKICPDSVVAIFLSHTDGDHTKALSLFPKAVIYLSKVEEQMINGEKSRFLFFKNSLGGRNFTTLDDNQTVNLLMLSIQGILIPGHTPGSMSYLVNEKYLFTGDALGLKDGKICGFTEFFNMDTKTALQSMPKLTSLPKAEFIFTAHHGFSSNYKEAVSGWK